MKNFRLNNILKHWPSLTVGFVAGVFFLVSCGGGSTSQTIAAAANNLWQSIGSNIYYMGGNVGINTNAPLRKLDVNGHLVLNTDASSPFESGGELVIANGDPNLTPTWHIDQIPSNIFRIFHQNNINTAGGTVLAATMQGNIGIGTETPASTLQVNGYIQLATLGNAAPPAIDCNQTTEYGRMKIDEINALLYICTAAGWVAK